jgi:NTP pyrophosphatase (non-canonical NTP hydrolase)
MTGSPPEPPPPPSPRQAAPPGSFQRRIEEIYFARDAERGIPRTLLWFVEEVGELVRAIRRQQRANLEEEFGDVYAWLATLASLHGVDLEAVGRQKYEAGCPRCQATPCACPHPTLV